MLFSGVARLKWCVSRQFVFKMMGGSNSGVSVGYGEAVSYERWRRDVLAGVWGFSPGKFWNVKAEWWHLEMFVALFSCQNQITFFFWSHVYAAAYLRTGSYATVICQIHYCPILIICTKDFWWYPHDTKGLYQSSLSLQISNNINIPDHQQAQWWLQVKHFCYSLFDSWWF